MPGSTQQQPEHTPLSPQDADRLAQRVFGTIARIIAARENATVTSYRVTSPYSGSTTYLPNGTPISKDAPKNDANNF